MRVVYLIPGAMSKTSLGAAELRRREGMLRTWAFPGTDVDVIDLPNGVASIESMYEELIAAPMAVERIRELEAEGADAVIIGCAGDPGLEAAREMVRIPVIGPGEASFLLGAHLGHRIGMLTVFDSLAASHRQQAFRAGVLDKYAGARGLEIPVLDLMRDRDTTFERIAAVGRRAMEADGADVLILGCMTMSFLDVAPRLSAMLGIPVVNAGQAALKAAEVQVSIRLAHSKKAFPLPPKMQVVAASRAN
jgi:allantoin racemase